jgi:hypothetical protein
MPQTSFQSDPDIAYEGQIAYPMLPRVVMSRAVAQVGGIPFGRAVVRAADRTVKLPAAGADITNTFEGFALRQEYNEADSAGYANLKGLPVLRRGFIWVYTEGAVTEEGLVYARHTANGGNVDLGRCRADVDSSNAAQIPNAKFVSSTTAAGFAIVEVR